MYFLLDDRKCENKDWNICVQGQLLYRNKCTNVILKIANLKRDFYKMYTLA